MEPDLLLGLAVFAPLLGGLLTLLLPRTAVALRVLLATAGSAAACALVLAYLNQIGGLAAVADNTAAPGWQWMPSLHLNLAFLADGLGLFFALLVAGIGTLIALYARAYFGPQRDDLYRFYPTLGFFTTAMLGIVLADYLLLTLLFWELTSISSFLLIGWDRYDKHAVKLAMQAFFTTGMGGMALFGGILLFGQTTDIWQWSTLLADVQAGAFALPAAIDWQSPLMWAFLLMFFGAATKSAQWPFHYWLPGAMAAPTPVSAFLHSATMVKAGVFLVGRMFPVFAVMQIWPWLIIPLGAITMLLGALIAINQHDLKRIFAYTTVSQLGLLMCMYGLGALRFEHDGHLLAAIDWDITQIANHALYKAPLFIVAGALGHVASRQLPELFGAVKRHTAMVIVMLMAGWALAALPGSISFQAKELFLYAIYHLAEQVHPAFWILMGMAVLTAILNMAIFVRLFTTLLGIGPGLRPVPASQIAPANPDAAVAPDPHAPDHSPGHGLPGHDAHRAAHEDAAHAHDEHHHEGGLWGAMLWLPALLIVIPQFIGGLYPPAWEAIFRPLETNLNYFHAIPALWALDFNSVPLWMSGVGYVVGLAVGLSPLMRGAIVDVHDRIYPAIYRLAVEGGGVAFRLVQTGHVRHYFLFVLITLLACLGGAMMIEPGMVAVALEAAGDGLEYWPGVLMGVVVCAAALALPMTQNRVLRVLLLGACGFSVVGMYLVYQAPDLALTQLMFEIISVILFLLVLRLLPEAKLKPPKGRLWRLAVSAVVGLALGWMTLIAASVDRPVGQDQLLGTFFANHSNEGTAATLGRGGGGSNIVNVILVDFRGFDTLGEISVLSLAALGVWSLIPARKRNRFRPASDKERA